MHVLRKRTAATTSHFSLLYKQPQHLLHHVVPQHVVPAVFHASHQIKDLKPSDVNRLARMADSRCQALLQIKEQNSCPPTMPAAQHIRDLAQDAHH